MSTMCMCRPAKMIYILGLHTSRACQGHPVSIVHGHGAWARSDIFILRLDRSRTTMVVALVDESKRALPTLEANTIP